MAQTTADTLKALTDARTEYLRETDAKIAAAARAFARESTLAYSAAHPRREVTFCAAMGTTSLHVQRGGWMGRQTQPDAETEYLFSVDREWSDKGAPAFLHVLAGIEEQTGLDYVAGPYLLTCKGGAVVKEATQW